MKIGILSKGSANYTTKRLKEAARERGHDVRVLDYVQCHMQIEENKPEVYYKGKPLTDIDVIIPRISARFTSYGAAVVRQFEMQGVYTPQRSIAIVRTRDKLRSMQLLAREGIEIPKTMFAMHASSTDALIEQTGGAPLIVKLARSTHGKGVVIAETRKAAKSVIQAFYAIGASFLVQEFVAEAGGSDIRAIVVGGRVVGAMRRQGLDDDFRSNIHLGGKGEKIVLNPDEKRLAIKAAKRLGLDIAGVDMIQSKRGPLVIEVNSSPGLEGIEKATGKDLATRMIKHIELNAKRKPRKDRVGA